MHTHYIFDVVLAPLWQLVLCTSAAGSLYKPAVCAAGKFLGFEDRKGVGKSVTFTGNIQALPPALLISYRWTDWVPAAIRVEAHKVTDESGHTQHSGTAPVQPPATMVILRVNSSVLLNQGQIS